jgi:hypothetical protein
MYHRLGEIMKRCLVFVILLLALTLVAGCAAGPNSMVDTPNEEGAIAGFWQGLWHGIIAPITFVISLFNSDVGMYAIHNNGGWYNAGFLFGLGAIWGGGGSGAKRARRARWKE